MSSDSNHRLVSGFSFVSLPTSDETLYKSTIDFYTKLGFSKFQEYDHSNANSHIGIKGVATHARDSLKETWLVAVPDFEGSNNTGATVKVRLASGAPGAQETQAKLQQLKQNKDKDYRSLDPSFVFSSLDLSSVAQILGSFGGHVLTAPAEAAPIEAYAFDPLGNVLGFTTRQVPFTTKDVISASTTESVTGPGSVAGGSSAAPSVHGGSEKKKRIGVMTSGGDAPGMNACVRAVVRTAIYRGCEAYAIYEGYQGLVNGGDFIKEMSWDDVRGFLSIGGTVIGTARCMDFKERAGRLQAAHNMILAGIDALVVCGGDGSLTGADRFRAEWPSLMEELVSSGKCSKEDIAGHENLYICGLVGSIDNDMSSTDATIGAYSSLDRICQSVDYIDATAQSHSRAFVIEVMGRHCGWLALMAGLATGADYIFIPEQPPNAGEWADKMNKIVKRHRDKGMRKTIVIVAEGAIDTDLNPITPDMVKDALVELGLDTRVTTLGHVQRGGTAVAFDRMLATMQGVEAVEAILELSPDTPSPMIGISENKIVRRPLVDAVKLTQSVAEAIQSKQFDKAMGLRDSEFLEHLENFLTINSSDNEVAKNPADKKLKIAIMNVGAPAGGMNMATKAAACYCFSRAYEVYGIRNGFPGLARHAETAVKRLNWFDVEQWGCLGGSELGCNRTLPDCDMGMIAYYFQKYGFDGLILVGGFEAYHSLHLLHEARSAYPAFRIPMACLPATISNNCPGTESSLGSDTCLNTLVQYCDVIKQSASSSRRRTFVVETQGAHTGYISGYSALVTGAHVVYTPEEGISLKQLTSDIDFLKDCFAKDAGRNRAGRLVIRNEQASKTFSTEVLAEILQSESEGKFETRAAIPGHVQQGSIPSPMDRTRATRLAIQAAKFIEKMQDTRAKPVYEQGDMYAVVGVQSSKLVFTPVQELWEYETILEERKGRSTHWDRLIHINDMLHGRPKVE